jgi:hypothetical protein
MNGRFNSTSYIGNGMQNKTFSLPDYILVNQVFIINTNQPDFWLFRNRVDNGDGTYNFDLLYLGNDGAAPAIHANVGKLNPITKTFNVDLDGAHDVNVNLNQYLVAVFGEGNGIGKVAYHKHTGGMHDKFTSQCQVVKYSGDGAALREISSIPFGFALHSKLSAGDYYISIGINKHNRVIDYSSNNQVWLNILGGDHGFRTDLGGNLINKALAHIVNLGAWADWNGVGESHEAVIVNCCLAGNAERTVPPGHIHTEYHELANMQARIMEWNGDNNVPRSLEIGFTPTFGFIMDIGNEVYVWFGNSMYKWADAAAVHALMAGYHDIYTLRNTFRIDDVALNTLGNSYIGVFFTNF